MYRSRPCVLNSNLKKYIDTDNEYKTYAYLIYKPKAAASNDTVKKKTNFLFMIFKKDLFYFCRNCTTPLTKYLVPVTRIVRTNLLFFLLILRFCPSAYNCAQRTKFMSTLSFHFQFVQISFFL